MKPTQPDWKEEFDKFMVEEYGIWKIGRSEVVNFIESLLLSQQAQYRAELEKACPPHNMIPYVQTGAWSASVPPPNMKCTKCLMTDRF